MSSEHGTVVANDNQRISVTAYSALLQARSGILYLFKEEVATAEAARVTRAESRFRQSGLSTGGPWRSEFCRVQRVGARRGLDDVIHCRAGERRRWWRRFVGGGDDRAQVMAGRVRRSLLLSLAPRCCFMTRRAPSRRWRQLHRRTARWRRGRRRQAVVERWRPVKAAAVKAAVGMAAVAMVAVRECPDSFLLRDDYRSCTWRRWCMVVVAPNACSAPLAAAEGVQGGGHGVRAGQWL